MSITLYVSTDQVLRIPDVTDRDGTPQTDADVDVTLLTRAGDEIAGTWPQAAAHTADGDYELELGDALAITAGARYRARIVITLADGVTQRTIWADVYAERDEA